MSILRISFLFALLLALPVSGAGKFEIPVTYYKLPNGLRVAISENHSAPVVAVAVYYRTGFRSEPKGQTGFAHLFEHMMFQGSENVTKAEFSRLIEGNGGSFNGSTNFDFTNYYEVFPSNRVETALWMEADRMRALKVNEENLANQKEVVMEEVRVNVLNQPYALFFWIDLWQNANQNWYNSHNGYGDFTDLRAATTRMADDFYKTYYSPNNAALAIVGDVETEAVKKAVQKYFQEIPQRAQPQRFDVSEPPQKEEKKLQQKDKLANLPGIAVGYHLPPQQSPDFAAASLLNLVIGGDQSSRLYQRLVKEKQMCLNWTSSTNIFGSDFDYDGPMLLTMNGIYKPNFTGADIVREIDDVIAKVSTEGVTEKELEDAKTTFRSGLYDLVSTPVGTAQTLAALALFRDNPGAVNTLLDTYMKVKTSDLQAAAAKYLVSSNRTIIDRTPEKGGK
jgi:zinc protease